jgi:hypothetical protein
VELMRHRQTKEAATDRFYLKPPRHISTLPMLLKKSVLSGLGSRLNFCRLLLLRPATEQGSTSPRGSIPKSFATVIVQKSGLSAFGMGGEAATAY